jgi:hypothetical protein
MRPVLARALTAICLAALVLAPVTSSAAAAPALPPVHHIWQIQLENETEAASFGQAGSYLNSLSVPEVPSSAALGATGLGVAGILIITRRRRADAGPGPRSGYSY